MYKNPYRKAFAYALFCVLLTTAMSCAKKYEYIEVIKESNLLSKGFHEKRKEPEKIVAVNDSAAFIKAYEKFCISELVAEKMKKKGLDVNLVSTPLYFKLYDRNGKEVEPVSYSTLEKTKNRIARLSIDNTETAVEHKVTIDSTTIHNLSHLFSFKKDEFSPRGITWVMPKSIYNFSDGIGSGYLYCYFMSDENGVSNFRLTMQYYGEEWLFFHKCLFAIDGNAYEFVPYKVERDHESFFIWEWFDEQINTQEEIDLIRAIASAKHAKVKFVGKYSDVRNISKDQIECLQHTVDLYIAMGGQL